MRRIALWALAVLLGAAPAEAAWNKAESTHFTIYFDGDAEKLRQFATQLEKFDAAIRVVFGREKDEVLPAQKLTVFVAANRSSVERLYGKGGTYVAGFYRPGIDGSYAFVPKNQKGDDWELNGQQILLHEYAHHFMFVHWPQTPNPAWFVEGFAEFLATAEFPADGSVVLGKIPMYRLADLQYSRLSLKTIFQSRVFDLPEEGRFELYARGWLITHYMLTRTENHGRYSKLIAGLAAGKTALQAATDAFGSLETFRTELEAYKGASLKGFVVGADKLKIDTINIQPLAPGAAAVMPYLMMSKRGTDRAAAVKLLADVHKVGDVFADDPAVQNEFAEAEFDAGNWQQSFDRAKRAATLDPSSIHALLYEGMATIFMAKDHHDPKGLAGARQYLLAANKLDVNNPMALFLYYVSFTADGGKASVNAENALLRAADIAGYDLGVRFTAAKLLFDRGDKEKARAVLGTIANDPNAGTLGAQARDVIGRIDAANQTPFTPPTTAPSGEKQPPAPKDGKKADDTSNDFL